MATIYVGPTAAGLEDGTSWANRYGSLNAAEDRPIVANDTVYVAPGVYRELLTCDVSGNAGNPITYIADVTGEHTDGVGGIVRVTGSDNDQTTTRTNCVTMTARDYRTFRGFLFDVSSSFLFNVSNCQHLIIEDCYFGEGGGTAAVYVASTSTNVTVRRCDFVGGRSEAIYFIHSATVDDTANVVENCLLQGSGGVGRVRIERIGGITIRNCTIISAAQGVRVLTSPAAGQTITVNNCIISCCGIGLQAAAAGFLVENYNAFFGNGSDRSNVAVGANSVAHAAIFQPRMLYSGYRFPSTPGDLAEWSTLNLAGTGETTTDLYGIAKPATAAKSTWGAVQLHDAKRDTATTRGASTASLALHDAGVHHMWVPVDGTEITVSVYCYREDDYAGTLPRMVIKQPGQANRTTTDVGASEAWNQLTDTFTPSATPPYIVVELQSSNTAVAGDYAAYFDDLDVS